MTNTEWIDLKFIATVINRQSLLNRANEAIENLEYNVRELEPPSPLPIATNKVETPSLKPKWDTSEITLLDFIFRYKESITHIDLSLSRVNDQNNLLVAIIRHCKNLEQLTLEGKYLELNSFQNFNSLTKLRHLDICYCPVTPNFTGMTQLTTLRFSSPVEQATSLDLTPLSNLENLALECYVRTDITHLKKLKTLKISFFENNCPNDLTIFPQLITLDIFLDDHPVPRLPSGLER